MQIFDAQTRIWLKLLCNSKSHEKPLKSYLIDLIKSFSKILNIHLHSLIRTFEAAWLWLMKSSQGSLETKTCVDQVEGSFVHESLQNQQEVAPCENLIPPLNRKDYFLHASLLPAPLSRSSSTGKAKWKAATPPRLCLFIFSQIAIARAGEIMISTFSSSSAAAPPPTIDHKNVLATCINNYSVAGCPRWCSTSEQQLHCNRWAYRYKARMH